MYLLFKIKTFIMKYRENRWLMKKEKRSYWPSGKSSFVTSLPNKWIKDYARKSSKDEIMMSQIGETLLITPKKDKPPEKPLTIVIQPNDSSKVYYSIISAYIQGYDEVCLLEKSYQRDLIDKVMTIQNKLPGAIVEPKAEGEYKIKFTNLEEKIPTILDKMHEHYQTLYNKNNDLFKDIDGSDINTKFNFVQYTEKEVDKIGFQLKRLFTRVFDTVLYDPEILLRTGLAEKEKDVDYSVVAKSVAYSVVASNLERLTDIQVEIFEILKDMTVDEKGRKILGINKDYGFDKYYNAANKMVEDAYNSKNNLKCLLKVLRSENQKEGGISFREEYISPAERKQILDLAEKNPNLIQLEGRIWANTGLATNIAEAWINMSDLAELNPVTK